MQARSMQAHSLLSRFLLSCSIGPHASRRRIFVFQQALRRILRAVELLLRLHGIASSFSLLETGNVGLSESDLRGRAR